MPGILAPHAGVSASSVLNRLSLGSWLKQNHRRFDSVTNGFSSRQLLYIASEIVKTEFAPLFFRKVLGPCIVAVPEGYRTYAWQQSTAVGETKAIANATDDMPSVERYLEEFDQRFQAYGVGYGYSIFDQAAEAVAQMPITIEKGLDCRDFLERRHDDVAKNGDTLFKLRGLFDHADIPVLGTTTGYTSTEQPALSGFSDDWLSLLGSDANKLLLIKAFTDAAVAITRGSSNVEKGPFVFAMGTELFYALNNTPRSSLSDTMLLPFLKGSNSLIADIVEWPDLATAGADGGNRVLIFTRDPRKLKYLEAVNFKQMPPREKGTFGYEVGCYAVSGGVVLPKPRAHLYVDMNDGA